MDTSIPPEENIICRCFVVSEYLIRQAIREGKLKAVEEVTLKTQAGGGCQSCWNEIDDILGKMWKVRKKKPVEEDPKETYTTIQKRGLIVRLLHKEMRALLELNGIKAELVDVKKDVVSIRFKGKMVGTQNPSFLSLKRQLVQAMSQVCHRPMKLLEVNVLEEHGTRHRDRT